MIIATCEIIVEGETEEEIKRLVDLIGSDVLETDFSTESRVIWYSRIKTEET